MYSNMNWRQVPDVPVHLPLVQVHAGVVGDPGRRRQGVCFQEEPVEEAQAPLVQTQCTSKDVQSQYETDTDSEHKAVDKMESLPELAFLEGCPEVEEFIKSSLR